jgi:hypothetical protein
MHILSGPSPLIPQVIFNTLKIFVYGLAAPFLLIAVLAAFTCVLLDFAWFRTHEMLRGNPQPKALWEF